MKIKNKNNTLITNGNYPDTTPFFFITLFFAIGKHKFKKRIIDFFNIMNY